MTSSAPDPPRRTLRPLPPLSPIHRPQRLPSLPQPSAPTDDFATKRRLRMSMAAGAMESPSSPAKPAPTVFDFAEHRRQTRRSVLLSPSETFAGRRRSRMPSAEATRRLSPRRVASPSPDHHAIEMPTPKEKEGRPSGDVAIDVPPEQAPAQSATSHLAGRFLLAFFDCQLGHSIVEWFAMMISAHRQTRRTLEMELADGVVLPPSWAPARPDLIQDMMEQYPLQPILCVSGLRADLLREVPLCMNPVVRVSVVDVQTGQLLEKAHPQWSVVTRYESPGSRILPVQTEPWDIVGRRVLAPVWEEPVIFNESLQHFFQHRVLILFEILDFGPHVNLNMYPSGTLPIAWAFVKPLSASGAPNHGHIRVQLYEYTREAATRERSGALRPYVEYVVQKNCGFVPYPSSLYLNLRGIAPLRSRIVRGKRPRLPTDIEQGRIGYDEMRSKFGPASPTDTPGHARDSAPVSTRQRSNCRQRLRGDPCLVPNEEAGRLSSGTLGAFVVEFSPDGRFVAAACAEYLMFPVKLFDSDGGTLEHTFAGHYGLVHDLAWSADARFLASASADNTVKIWAKERGVSAIASLQHLAFVYSARFVPTHDIDAVVVTAGVDRVVRVWDALQGAVIHELSGHDAPINSIAVDQQGLRMWTGDASGSVKSWDRDLPQSASRFRPVHRLQHPELKDVAITSVRHDPVRDSIVVMARNHLLYVFGVRRYDLRRVLSGVQCDHSAIRAQFSPDGAFVVSGSEDGKVHVWRVASGELVSQIETGYTAACYGVAWHPSQHLIAACSFGGDYPIMVFDCIDGSGAAPDPVASADSPRRQTHLPGAIS